MRIRSLHLVISLVIVLAAMKPAKSSSIPGSATKFVAQVATQEAGVDLTRLPIGDNRLATSPKVGWIWPCRTDPDAGGAFKKGPWIKADGTYDFTAKAVVDGEIAWSQHSLEVKLVGDKRVVATNDLPNHKTGIYPIAQNDDAYQYDRNPNRINPQKIQLELPANPTLAPQPSCAPGAVGILLTGSVLFNALDAPGRDAVAHETQDACQGHPQMSGSYHYHNLTTCLPDAQTGTGHSPLMGYSLDGFGIFGRHGEGGKMLMSADLDECHGHTHEIEWDGKKVAMYHYHATWDFPYTIGCMRGTVKMSDVMAISGGPGRPGGQGGPGAPGAPGGRPPRRP
jgi:hypothetical protein